MKPRIIFIHGNQTMTWDFAWAPWLKQELAQRGYATRFETFPDSIIARARYWLPFLEEYLRAGANDVLVGWSSGATAALRYAADHRIRGSVLIAPSYTDLGDALEKQSGYFDSPWPWDRIKANQEHLVLVHSDNDPFIPTSEFEFMAEALRPEVIKIPGGRHFIERQTFPEILEYLERTYQ